MCFPWAPSVRFASSACFTADAAGQMDLSRQKPDSGSYDFVDSMGLIVSLKCQDPQGLSNSYELVVYEDAGEPTPPPYVIPSGESSVRVAPRVVLSLGGNARAQAEGWEKIIAFFKHGNKNQAVAAGRFLFGSLLKTDLTRASYPGLIRRPAHRAR